MGSWIGSPRPIAAAIGAVLRFSPFGLRLYLLGSNARRRDTPASPRAGSCL